MRSLAVFCLLLAAAPQVTARPAAPRTGRYIVKLKATPPPPRLLAIDGRLEEADHDRVAGGKRTPYLLVEPNKPERFELPRTLRTLVEYVEPEIYMWTQREPPRPSSQFVGLPRRGIGEPASGTFSGLPRSLQTAPASVPNDPGWRDQWGLWDSGFGVRLPTARRWGRGAGVTVGVIDSGVRTQLSDLNGTTFLPAYNALTTSLGGSDDNGHGSHVTGTIAQVTDNNAGCAGIAPAARILSVKVTDRNGRGTNFSLAAGIRYAADNGCRIANMSVGGAPSRTLQDAVRYAHGKGMLLVASAGNGGAQPGGNQLLYPARYPETLSVGAINPSGIRCAWSQYGTGLSIVAPGERILQQTFDKNTGRIGYFKYSGTSMAAPHVSGVAALVLSLRPTLSLADLRGALTGTAIDLGPRGYDTQYGAGLVNAAAACERVAGQPGDPSPQPTPMPMPPEVPFPEPEPVPVPPVEEGVVGELLRLHNMERSRAGLSAFRLDPQLTEAARVHAEDMRQRNGMSHTGSDGSGPGERIARTGYQGVTWAENVAAGYTSATAVMNGWMGSPGHRANILGARLTECGLARAGNYWCTVFGAKR